MIQYELYQWEQYLSHRQANIKELYFLNINEINIVFLIFFQACILNYFKNIHLMESLIHFLFLFSFKPNSKHSIILMFTPLDKKGVLSNIKWLKTLFQLIGFLWFLKEIAWLHNSSVWIYLSIIFIFKGKLRFLFTILKSTFTLV